ncbi:GOLPH3/VPS74 family protein [Myceligenerans salitolerans]|uniref:GPP34 family phosphoprotein n=1 Tax=Myceligenerans salitolerans TaxID=1230528 RepID=A0ABS3I8I2_9MICO|nr:GPP34 family phosphoprotein [Myceligenerans salitolerans]MBO0609249.1 GPP34 family phosphoprotein [Myceligenerans salitolerans]
MTTELTLAEQVLLLALDDESGRPLTDSTRLHAGLAGAVLLDLIRAGALELAEHDTDVRAGRLRRTGRNTPGDPLLAEILDRAHGKKPRDAVMAVDGSGGWVNRAGRLKERMLHDLAGRGLLREEHGTFLRIFPTTSWPAGEPGPEAEIVSRVRVAMTTPGAPDRPTAVLVGILNATQLLHRLIPEIPKKELKRRAQEVADQGWAGEAVDKAVEQAVMTAVMAAMAGAAAAGAAGAGGS